jgi:hypothetical protein
LVYGFAASRFVSFAPHRQGTKFIAPHRQGQIFGATLSSAKRTAIV